MQEFSYSVTFKLQVVQYAKEYGNRAALMAFWATANEDDVLFEGFDRKLKIMTTAWLVKMKIFNGILLWIDCQ